MAEPGITAPQFRRPNDPYAYAGYSPVDTGGQYTPYSFGGRYAYSGDGYGPGVRMDYGTPTQREQLDLIHGQQSGAAQEFVPTTGWPSEQTGGGYAYQAPKKTEMNDPGTTGGMNKVSAIFDMVHMAVRDQMDMINFVGNIKKDKEEKKRWDKTFAEKVRMGNLDFALRDFSIRKGLELREVQQQFQNDLAKANFDLNKMISDINAQTANINRISSGYKLWDTMQNDQDRRGFANSIVKSLARGLKG